ncbi:MAG: hypothetical protein ACAH89_07170 [Rariglobus sp.]|nr:hypothetical protein [Rariglobus sp.]
MKKTLLVATIYGILAYGALWAIVAGTDSWIGPCGSSGPFPILSIPLLFPGFFFADLFELNSQISIVGGSGVIWIPILGFSIKGIMGLFKSKSI